MADTLIDGVNNSSLDHAHMGPWGPYYMDGGTKGVIFSIDTGDDLFMRRTTDGGDNWTRTEVKTDTIRGLACYFDRGNSSDTGTLIYVAYMSEATGAVFFRTVDVDDATVGTERNTVSITPSSTIEENRISVVKTDSGNIIIVYKTPTEVGARRSTDLFASNNDSINTPFEAIDQNDWAILGASNTGDDNDAFCAYGDSSAGEYSLKMWDNSAGNWVAETSMNTGFTINNESRQCDLQLRHSDRKAIFAAHQRIDVTTDDILTFELAVDSVSAPTSTAKANAVTNVAESGGCGVWINQQIDQVRVISLKGSPTWAQTTKMVFYISDDDLATFGSEQAYSEDAADDNRSLSASSGPTSLGGRFQPSMFDDDDNDVFINLTNDLAVAAVAAGDLIEPPLLHTFALTRAASY